MARLNFETVESEFKNKGYSLNKLSSGYQVFKLGQSHRFNNLQEAMQWLVPSHEEAKQYIDNSRSAFDFDDFITEDTVDPYAEMDAFNKQCDKEATDKWNAYCDEIKAQNDAIDEEEYIKEERYCIQHENDTDIDGALNWEWELNVGAVLAVYPPLQVNEPVSIYMYWNNFHNIIVAGVGNEFASIRQFTVGEHNATKEVVIELGTEVQFLEGIFVWDGRSFVGKDFNEYLETEDRFVVDGINGYIDNKIGYFSFLTEEDIKDMRKQEYPTEAPPRGGFSWDTESNTFVNEDELDGCAYPQHPFACNVVFPKKTEVISKSNYLIEMLLLGFHVKLTATVIELYCAEISKDYVGTQVEFDADSVGTEA